MEIGRACDALLFKNNLIKKNITLIDSNTLFSIFNKFDKEPLKVKIDKTINENKNNKQ